MAAPQTDLRNENVKKRVERHRRGLFGGSPEKRQLDLENYAPLQIVETSLEQTDNKGDNELNGTKVIDDKNIKYYHKKNKGTVKTLVEEKKDNKIENVFYHLSYEKTTTEQDSRVEETTRDTTDQTLQDEVDEEEVEEDTKATQDNKQDDADDLLIDLTVPTEEEEDGSEEDQAATTQKADSTGGGWLNTCMKWLIPDFNFASTTTTDLSNSQQNADYDVVIDGSNIQTTQLDKAIQSQSQFAFLTPFMFGSIGLRSPSCPAQRPTLISIYFFSFCV